MGQRVAGAWMRFLNLTVLVIGGLLVCGGARCHDSVAAKGTESTDEIPIEKCDMLPVVRVKIAGSEMRACGRNSGRGPAGQDGGDHRFEAASGFHGPGRDGCASDVRPDGSAYASLRGSVWAGSR